MRNGCGSWPNKQDILERRLTMFQADGVIGIRGRGQSEEEEHHRNKRQKWTREREGFECTLEALVIEKDGLVLRLEDLDSVPNASRLLCKLIVDRLAQM